MKKAFCVLFALLVCLLTASPAWAVEEGYTPDGTISAKAVYLYNLDTETLIYSRDADKPLPPASLTKVMTCILALENTANLDTEILTYPSYVQDYLYNYSISVGSVSLAGDLRANDQMTMRQALYALMLPSANEVAMIIADHIGGSQEGFAKMMNDRARELGATNTNFVNPNGLYDEKHLTSAYDLFLITRHGLTLPEFEEITSTYTYESGPIGSHSNITWNSTNLMMNPDSSYYYPALRGVKTGTVPQAGRCFISTASKDGFTYLLVLMGSDYLDENGAVVEPQMAFTDTRRLYEWVFDTFKNRKIIDQGTREGEITLNLSLDQDYLSLMASDLFTALLPDTVDLSRIEKEAVVPDSWDAPVTKGERIGELILKLDGEELGRVDLLAADSVEASPFLVLLEKVLDVTRSFWFKFTVIFIILLIIFYVLLTILRHRRRRRSNYKPRRRI